MIINIHITWIPKPIKPFCIFIFPTYILNGKSLTYWNGKNFEISFKNGGKKGIGTTSPDNKSAITTKIFTTPFSFIVNKVIIGYNVDKAIINNDPINSDTIDFTTSEYCTPFEACYEMIVWLLENGHIK